MVYCTGFTGICAVMARVVGGSFMRVVARDESETWAAYVARIAAGMTHAQIAAKTGGVVSMSNIGRWLRGELTNPGAESVIAFAQGFGQPPVEALIVAGYLDADAAAQRTPLSAYTDIELLDELRRRTLK